MNFSRRAWKDSLPLYQLIMEMPFIRELISGSLPRESFDFYMEQDAAYLMDFSSLLSILSSKMKTVNRKIKCLKFSSHALEAEIALHEKYVNDKSKVVKGPACQFYTDFLHRAVTQGDEVEGMAALLPCFSVYKRVGDEVYNEAKAELAHNPYRDWIEMYSSEDFAQEVEEAEDLMNQLLKDAPEKEALCLSLYRKSSAFEHLFWDYAYKRVTWDTWLDKTEER